MNLHLKGVQQRDGQVAIVGAILFDDGTELEILFPPDFAHTLGCFLIEMSFAAKELQPQLAETPTKLFDVTQIDGFGNRIAERMRLNGSSKTVNLRAEVRGRSKVTANLSVKTADAT